MADDAGIPNELDGPLMRAASKRAEAIDTAETPAERRGAWARFVLPALAALAEGFLRQSMITGAAVLSLIVAVGSALSGEPGWIVGGLVAGIGGAILVFVAVTRWSFARQWAVLLTVMALQVALLVWGAS